MVKRLGLLAALLLFSTMASALERGDWVLAQWKGGEYWFPGVVEGLTVENVVILYDDGTRETRPVNQVRRYDWRVGTRVSCRWAGGKDWYAGKIAAMNPDGITLQIAYDDGDKEVTRTGFCRSK